jgi:hypothetical protein
LAETVFRGPAYSAGSMMDNRVESASDGPGIEYQANCFPDVRWGPTRKDGIGPGRVPAFLNSPFVVTVDTIPSSTATASIAALANVTNGTPMTMTTVAPGGSAQNVPSLSPGMPLVPFQKNASSVVTTLGLDFGFTTGNITAGSATISNISDSSIFQLGQWICIGGGGNAAKTASLFAQVTGAPTATTITVSPAPLATLTAAPIGSTNLPSGAFTQPQAYPPGFFAVPTSPDPYLAAGFARIFNPNEGLGRNIQITGVASGTGGVFIVRGWDVYGNPMSENITVAANANTVAGKKAFKYLATGTTNATGGIVPQFTDAHNYSAGPGNVVGINLRSLFWEYMNIFYNSGFAVTNAGWTAADQTNPATATTGDVRGTINASTLATIGAALDGTKRMTLAMTVRLIDDISGTPLNAVPLFGVPQFTQ